MAKKKKKKTSNSKVASEKKNRRKKRVAKRDLKAKTTSKPKKKVTKKVSKTSVKGKTHAKKKVLFYKNKWFIVTAGVLLLIILFLGFTAYKKNKSEIVVKFDKISVNKYLNLYDDKATELKFVYITNDECYLCSKYELNLNKISTDYKIKIEELNISNLSDKDIKNIKEKSEFLSNGLEIPILLSIKDGKEINGISGIKEYSVLKKFVEYSKNPTNNSFNKISVNKYISLLNSKEISVIYIGRSSDKACESFSKVLETVSSKNKIKVNYLNTDEIITEDGWDVLEGSNKIFSDMWFVPAIIITKNGEIVDYRMESLNEEELVNFFSKNGL